MIDENCMHHLQQIIVRHVFSELFGYVLQMLELNHAILFLVVDIEDSSDSVFGPYFSSEWTDYINKLLKRELFVSLSQGCDNLNNVGISFIQTKLL